MSTPRGSLIPREVETPKELQLRVTPSELKFQDTAAGRVYRQPITVHNLGRSNQKIRFLDPVKPQVRHPGVLRAGPPRAVLGGCLAPWAPALSWGAGPGLLRGWGAGLGFLGIRDLSVSMYMCARLFVNLFLLRVGTEGGEIRWRTSQFLCSQFGKRGRGLHVCLRSAQNLCRVIL